MPDRSSRPHRSPTPAGADAPRPRSSGCGASACPARPSPASSAGRVSTVGAVLRRLGLGRLAALDPKPPVVRYEREQPGELIHIDTKKLGRIDGVGHRITGDRRGQSSKRGIGWEFLHVASTTPPGSPTPRSCPTSARRAPWPSSSARLAWFAGHGVTVERVMTDNGSAYRSHALPDRSAEAGLRHKRTRPYTPRTNGKAERFIQIRHDFVSTRHPAKLSPVCANGPAGSAKADSVWPSRRRHRCRAIYNAIQHRRRWPLRSQRDAHLPSAALNLMSQRLLRQY